MPESNELRIFISSTFRDLASEREYLVKKIFPEIRSLCRGRGVTFTEVDLRWGITEEEAKRDGIIRICLDEIDLCRPYFIGILGERYGWAPPDSDVRHVADDFPELVASISEGTSITEMEIVHGVLANPEMVGHAFFYIRDPNTTPEEFVETDPNAVKRLADLKNRIRESGFPIQENFTSPAELGQWIATDLIGVLDQEHPETSAPSRLELERRAHTAFAQSRIRAYIPNSSYLQGVAEWAERLEQPLVVCGESGLGKSSLVAYATNEYRIAHPDAFVIEHYIGASDRSGSAVSVMRHVIEEICDRYSIQESLPTTQEELEKSFPNWLFRAEHRGAQAGVTTLIVIDGVNQLGEYGRRLAWLPKMMPSGVKLLISTTPGETNDRLAERDWNRRTVAPIEDDDTRQSIILQYLGEFRKGLTPAQVQQITSDKKSSSPLYLRVVAEELRLHGEHETLSKIIDQYVAAVDLHDVFDLILKRMEYDYSAVLVDLLFTGIASSRVGLSETELIAITGMSRMEMSRLLFAVDYHFVRRDGLLDFFHGYLRSAVESRYLTEEENRRALHRKLATYFSNQPLRLRTARELSWHYAEAGDEDALAAYLGRIDVLIVTGQDVAAASDVVKYWGGLRQSGYEAEKIYRASVDRYIADATLEHQLLGLGHLAEFLKRLGTWSLAIEINDRLIAIAEAHEKDVWIASGYFAKGTIQGQRGELERAEVSLSQAQQLFERSGDTMSSALAMANLANIYCMRGDLERGLKNFEESLAISKELGDRKGMLQAIGNMGMIHLRRGEHDRALWNCQEQLRISRESGDRSSAAIAVGNMGIIYNSLGDSDRALECVQQFLKLSTDLGDRIGMMHAQSSIGMELIDRGDYPSALAALEQSLLVAREIGDVYARIQSLEGEMYLLLECLKTPEEPVWLDTFLGLNDGTLRRAAILAKARELANEREVIENTGVIPEASDSLRMLIARIDAAEGDAERHEW